jgi:hypothetical protein
MRNELFIGIEKGVSLPELIISRCINGKNIDERPKTDRIKAKIMILLNKGEKLYISDFCEELDVEPDMVITAIKELEGEKRIRKSI